MAAADEDVKLLQTVDGVGPVTALAFKAEIDNPKRFEDSKDAAAYIRADTQPVFFRGST